MVWLELISSELILPYHSNAFDTNDQSEKVTMSDWKQNLLLRLYYYYDTIRIVNNVKGLLLLVFRLFRTQLLCLYIIEYNQPNRMRESGHKDWSLKCNKKRTKFSWIIQYKGLYKGVYMWTSSTLGENQKSPALNVTHTRSHIRTHDIEHFITTKGIALYNGISNRKPKRLINRKWFERFLEKGFVKSDSFSSFSFTRVSEQFTRIQSFILMRHYFQHGTLNHIGWQCNIACSELLW